MSVVVFQDLRHFFFASTKEQNQRRTLFDTLNHLVFPFSISKIDITKPVAFFSVREMINFSLETFKFDLFYFSQSFFAWNYKNKVCPNEIDEGWNLYDKVKEFTRMVSHITKKDFSSIKLTYCSLGY